MANLAKADVAYYANVLIRNNANAGISWGTNNYPAGALPEWFGGTTAGRGEIFGAGDLANPPTGRQVSSALNNFAAMFAAIRALRIVIYYRKTGSKNTTAGDYTYVAYDGTAIAHTAWAVGGVGNDVPPVLTRGVPARAGDVWSYCDRLWQRYNQLCRATAMTAYNTICHTSCHGACHGSRGRR
jgi:hypothetical protein